jgi:hypothetical protein
LSSKKLIFVTIGFAYKILLNPPLEKGNFKLPVYRIPLFLKGGKEDFSSPGVGQIFETFESIPSWREKSRRL